jgi:hypothetical protein
LVACHGDPCLSADDVGDAWTCGRDRPLTARVDGEVVEDGDALPLDRGAQGAQHVALTLSAPFSAEEIGVGRAVVRVGMWEVDARADDPPVWPLWEVGLALTMEGDEAYVPPFLWVVPDPDAMLGREGWWLASVRPVGGDVEANTALRVHLQWRPSDPKVE